MYNNNNNNNNKMQGVLRASKCHNARRKLCHCQIQVKPTVIQPSAVTFVKAATH